MIIEITINTKEKPEEYLLRRVDTDSAKWSEILPDMVESLKKYSYVKETESELKLMNE